MVWIRKVTGEDIRSSYEWLSKDPPFCQSHKLILGVYNWNPP